MLSKIAKASLFLTAVTLTVSPAHAEPGKARALFAQSKSNFDVEVSAARRHRHASRHHVQRHSSRHVQRVRARPARQMAVAPIVDRFGVGYQSTTVPQVHTPAAPTRRAMRAMAKRTPSTEPALASVSTGAFSSSLVAEARRYLGTNPTGRASLWCGHFMNMVLKRTGRAVSPSNQARSFASYGRRIAGPQIGAIAVMSRGRTGGHVGIVSGFDPNGNPILISGNHRGRVAEAVYPRGRIFAYVMP